MFLDVNCLESSKSSVDDAVRVIVYKNKQLRKCWFVEHDNVSTSNVVTLQNVYLYL